MEKVYISKISIKKVRHLENIEIPISEEEKKHIVFTGKNGSGKTSVLKALATFLNSLAQDEDPAYFLKELEGSSKILENKKRNQASLREINELEDICLQWKERFNNATQGVWVETVPARDHIRSLFESGKFVLGYYDANRSFSAIEPKHVEKVQLKTEYTINEQPSNDFLKYLLDMKMTQALALTGGKHEKAEIIQKWFDSFENLLKDIFDDPSIALVFDEDAFKFSLSMDNREQFDFNTLSSGYAAVLDIVVDLILRMENQTERKFDFSVPGIVIIDEIDAHLHLELQKTIMQLLSKIFPNIQFIVSTHSPFILSNIENAVIYDLEHRTLVPNGLNDVPYSGIVEGYFKVNELSTELEAKFDRYKELVGKAPLTDDDVMEIGELEFYLNEIPDYLALELTTEYQRLKLKLREREDI